MMFDFFPLVEDLAYTDPLLVYWLPVHLVDWLAAVQSKHFGRA